MGLSHDTICCAQLRAKVELDSASATVARNVAIKLRRVSGPLVFMVLFKRFSFKAKRKRSGCTNRSYLLFRSIQPQRLKCTFSTFLK